MTRINEDEIHRLGEQFGLILAERFNQALSHTVTVGKVDKDFAEVYEFEGDTPIRVPLLNLNVGAAVFKIKPKQDSVAVILYVEGDIDRPIFIGFTEVDEIDIVLGESSVLIKDGEINFNGGENGGLVLIEKLTDRLNRLQEEIDQIQTSILSHSHATPSGATTGTTYTKVQISRFDKSEYENEKILQ